MLNLSIARPLSNNQQYHNHNSFRLGSWNVGTLRGGAGKIVETLNRRETD